MEPTWLVAAVAVATVALGILLWSLEPPPRFRVKTTAPFKPVDVEPVAEVLPAFLALQDELRKRVEAADGLAVDRVKVTSPFLSNVKYNVYSAFVIALAHERRHLWQARETQSRPR